MKTYLWYQVCYITFLNRQEAPFSLLGWTSFAKHNQNYREILFYLGRFFPPRLEHNQSLCVHEAGGYEDLVFDTAVWGGPQETPFRLHKLPGDTVGPLPREARL